MKKSVKNILFGVVGQMLILALGIVVPRFILRGYGDEANGLLNAITQIFTYIALIEAGVGQAAVQALYKPIVNRDQEGINSVLSTTQNYYRKLTTIYLLIVVIVSFLYPVFIQVNDIENISLFGSSYWAIFFLVFINGISGAIGFYFTATLKQILLADGLNYVAVNITTVFKFFISLAKIFLVSIGINIVLMQAIQLCISVIEVIVFVLIFKKYYPWVRFDATPVKEGLKERNSFLVHEISNAIFSGTDMLVLSLFCDLTTVSIYAMYNLVFSALNTLIGQIHNGCYYILGQAYNNNKESYKRVHDAYDTYYIALVFSLMTVAYVFILPFIKLYTADVSTVNYINPWLPLLFCMINLLSCCRITSSNLIKISGNAKATISRTIIEMILNLVLSITLVQFVGIYGVLLGTVIALLYRTNDMILYANHRILSRSSRSTYIVIGINFIIFTIVALSTRRLNFPIENLIEFLILALVCTVISISIYFTINSIFNHRAFQTLKNAIMKKQL